VSGKVPAVGSYKVVWMYAVHTQPCEQFFTRREKAVAYCKSLLQNCVAMKLGVVMSPSVYSIGRQET
jgi:hypothetical protein